MFLPALLLTQIGAELHVESAHRYLIILIYALVCHFMSFLIGIAAHLVFGMPDWVTAALMFNNTTSYPLLLIQSLDETGILKNLIVTDESTQAAISRAKSYFLVFATVSSCLTFAVGPRLIDSEHSPDHPDDKDDLPEGSDDEETGSSPEVDAGEDPSSNEQTQLLAPERREARGSVASTTFFPTKSTIPYDRRPSVIAKRRWKKLSDRTRWWLLFLFDFINGPLIGAVIGTIIGLVPALQHAFFNETNDGGIFSAWLTPSLKNIGSIFVPLPVIIAGVSLYLSMKSAKKDGEGSGTPWLTTLFILVVRFLLWPVISIGFVYLLAKNTQILSNDPMLWFTMMLMPTGPSAMKLIAMVEVSGAKEEDEHKIAKLLTVSSSSSIAMRKERTFTDLKFLRFHMLSPPF
jgi:hypothetical protein